MRRSKKKLLLSLGILTAVIAVAFALLCWSGLILLPNEVSPNRWEMWGVDVSSYQGEVD